MGLVYIFALEIQIWGSVGSNGQLFFPLLMAQKGGQADKLALMWFASIIVLEKRSKRDVRAQNSQPELYIIEQS